jgi:hypothetical protein
LVAELDRIVENDRYPLSRRITALRAIRALLKPYPGAPANADVSKAIRAARQGPVSPPRMKALSRPADDARQRGDS